MFCWVLVAARVALVTVSYEKDIVHPVFQVDLKVAAVGLS